MAFWSVVKLCYFHLFSPSSLQQMDALFPLSDTADKEALKKKPKGTARVSTETFLIQVGCARYLVTVGGGGRQSPALSNNFNDGTRHSRV